MSRTRAIQIVGVLGVLLIWVGGAAVVTVINHVLFGTGAVTFVGFLLGALIINLAVSTWKELGQ